MSMSIEERTSVLVSNASRYEENLEAGGRCMEDEAGVIKLIN
jgi:hypothetical protein